MNTPEPTTPLIQRQAEVAASKEALRARLMIATGNTGLTSADEALIDDLFFLFKMATKHTIADIIARHGTTIMVLMALPYARNS